MAEIAPDRPDFILTDPDIQQYALQHAANMAGCLTSQVDRNRITELHENAMDGGIRKILKTEGFRELTKASEAARLSKGQELMQLAEALDGSKSRWLSLGTSFPSLVTLMHEVKNRLRHETPSILLVGAQSLATAEEFVALCRNSFANPALHIIEQANTRASEMSGNVTYGRANFLRESSPYPSDSFEIIMGDQLLPHIQPPASSHIGLHEAQQQFFKKVFATLKPGGTLILTDDAFPEETDEIINIIMASNFTHAEKVEELDNLFLERVVLLERALADQGFTNVRIEPLTELINRQEVLKTMLSGIFEWQPEQVFHARRISITAQKPEETLE